MTRRQVSLAVLAVLILTLVLVAPDVLLIIFAGLLFAVFLNAGGSFFARHSGLGTGLGVAAFGLTIIVVFAALFTWFAPSIARQFEELVAQVPTAFAEVEERIRDLPWGDRLLSRASPAGLFSSEGTQAATIAVSSTFGALGNFVIIVFIGIYGAVAPETYRHGIVELLAPSLRPRARVVLRHVAHTLRDWLTAQLMAMTIVGLLTGLGLWFAGIPLAFLLGLIAALLAFIPNIGPIIAAAPAVLLAIPEGASMVLLVVAIYLGVQTLESYIITPLIQQEKVSLPPALIISMQLLLGVLFGLLGLALATPLAAAGLALTREVYVRNYLDRERASAHGKVQETTDGD